MFQTTRREIKPFVNLTCLQTDKFKTGCLSVSLLFQLDRDTASHHAILPKVLLRGTERLQDLEAIAAYRDELYGARVEPVVRKKGEIQCTGFYADFVDDRFLPAGEAVLEKVASLLGELLLKPKMDGDQFVKSYVDGERENLIEEIRGAINEKRAYSIQRIMELMCDGEPFATPSIGTEAEAQDITAEALTAHYRKFLPAATIEIFYCGSADDLRVEKALTEALADLPRTEPDYDMGTDIRMNARDPEPRYFTDEMDVTQGKLTMGFRLGPAMEEPNFAELMLFNYLYGGSVNSKLFMNVREKLSLAYFASSVLEKFKGIMIVSSGIEFDKYDEAKSEILAQLEAVRNGAFAEGEVESARGSAVTDMLLSQDSPYALSDFYLGQAILGLGESPADFADMLKEVKVERCIEIAQGVELDAVYFLRAPEREGAVQ